MRPSKLHAYEENGDVHFWKYEKGKIFAFAVYWSLSLSLLFTTAVSSLPFIYYVRPWSLQIEIFKRIFHEEAK